jgi:phosphonoacetate hydrolase
MTAMHNVDWSPRVHYLSDVSEHYGVRSARVILPITDPYVRHHGALGSFAWVRVPEDEIERPQEVLHRIADLSISAKRALRQPRSLAVD